MQLIKHWNFVLYPEMRLANGFRCCQLGFAQRKSISVYCSRPFSLAPFDECLVDVTPNMAGLLHMRCSRSLDTRHPHHWAALLSSFLLMEAHYGGKVQLNEKKKKTGGKKAGLLLEYYVTLCIK